MSASPEKVYPKRRPRIRKDSCETEIVGERCTCGAVLVEGALFCHKCGKPQREIVEVETPAPPPGIVPPPVPTPTGPPIGFHNGAAVRIGMLGGILSIIL